MAFKTSIILILSILSISFGLSSTSVAQIERSVSIAEKNLKVKLNQSPVDFGNLTGANVFSKIGRFESTSVLYSVQWERRDWYFITDGKAKGWVSKKDVSLASKASSTASVKPIASPVKVISDLKKIGFGVDLSWRKSKLVPGEWFCQMRCYHGASGRLMTAAQLLKLDPASVYDGTKYNELNISLFGEDRSSLERIEVSAEIYQSKFQKKSFSTLLRAVEQVVGECPAQVKSAFESGKAYKRKPWLVERDYHNAGFDQDLTYFVEKEAKPENKTAIKNENELSASEKAQLGIRYAIGDGVVRDDEKAVALFKDAAKDGDWIAKHNLGVMYHSGQGGLSKDVALAHDLSSQAAKQGYAPALVCTGHNYLWGCAGPVDYSKAREYFDRAAEQEYVGAYTAIGCMYCNGTGVTQDYGEAIIWFQKAANKDLENVPKKDLRYVALAQYEIARFFFHGLGVPQNFNKAFTLLKSASENGCVEAQADLGWIYLNGFGVAKNYREGYRWIKKAAFEGVPRAQGNLGYCFANGFGVSRNLPEAYVWYSLASAKGMEDAAIYRDRARALMTSRQIATAQARAAKLSSEMPAYQMTQQSAVPSIKTAVIEINSANQRLQKIGLHQDIAWKKSNISDEWIAQYRSFNGSAGSKLSSTQASRIDGTGVGLNEISVELLGPDNNTITELTVSYEIYVDKYSAVTRKIATDALKAVLPNLPPNVVSAFEKGSNLTQGNWSVQKEVHKLGFDVIFSFKK